MDETNRRGSKEPLRRGIAVLFQRLAVVYGIPDGVREGVRGIEGICSEFVVKDAAEAVVYNPSGLLFQQVGAVPVVTAAAVLAWGGVQHIDDGAVGGPSGGAGAGGAVEGETHNQFFFGEAGVGPHVHRSGDGIEGAVRGHDPVIVGHDGDEVQVRGGRGGDVDGRAEPGADGGDDLVRSEAGSEFADKGGVEFRAVAAFPVYVDSVQAVGVDEVGQVGDEPCPGRGVAGDADEVSGAVQAGEGPDVMGVGGLDEVRDLAPGVAVLDLKSGVGIAGYPDVLPDNIGELVPGDGVLDRIQEVYRDVAHVPEISTVG